MNIKGLILCVCLFVSACAFKPLYANRDKILEQTAAIHVEPVVGEGSYQLGLKVATKLNPKHQYAQTKYRLNIKIENPNTENGSIRTDNFATLEKMSLKIDYQLFDISKNKNVLSSSVYSRSMYSMISNPYATEMAKEKLQKDLVDLLAEDIVTHIYSYFEEQNGES